MLHMLFHAFLVLIRGPLTTGLALFACGILWTLANKERKLKAASAKLRVHERRSKDVNTRINKMIELFPSRIELLNKAHQRSMFKLKQENRDLREVMNRIRLIVCVDNDEKENMRDGCWKEKEKIMEMLHQAMQLRPSARPIQVQEK